MMLPQEYYRDACKLFCTWLHRLEERDKRHAAQRKLTTETIPTSNVECRITARLPMPDLPESLNTRAEE